MIEYNLKALRRVADESAMAGADSEALTCPILRRFEELVEAVLASAPPSVATLDVDWTRLFRWCDTHRALLAERAFLWSKLAHPQRVDVWLRELARPPKGRWDGVRHGAISYIRLVGLPPRGEGEPMFTGMDPAR